MKKCPYCAEMILEDAIYCRYCHKEVTDNKKEVVHIHQEKDKKADLTGAIVPLAILIFLYFIGTVFNANSGGDFIFFLLGFVGFLIISLIGLVNRRKWGYYMTRISSIPYFFSLLLIPIGIIMLSTLNKPEVRKEFGFEDKKK